MPGRVPFALLCAAMVLLAGCAAGTKMQSMATANMAGALKAFCDEHAIRTAETRAADSLYEQAVIRQKKGQGKDALAARDLAITYYKLALARRELVQSEQRLESARELLRAEERELDDYRSVLMQLKGGAR